MTRVGARLDAFPVVEVHRWEVAQDSRMVGVLRLLRVQQPNVDNEFYQVQRPDGQVCGEIDLRGRGWRNEPFKKEMVFIGMGSMEENLAKLLEVDGTVKISDWNEKAAAEASMRVQARGKATQTPPEKAEETKNDTETKDGSDTKGGK